MLNPFDLDIEDQCLRFIRDDSSHIQSDLFQNNNENVKIEQEDNNFDMQQEDNSCKRKRNSNTNKSHSRKKVFYKDKMMTLISEQQMQSKTEYNYGDYYQNSRGKSPISRDQQLRRNRQSAKHSRQRRKQYVQALELKNSQNQARIEELNNMLREMQMERDKLKDDNRSYIKTFMSAKNQAYENLSETLSKCGNQSSTQLSQQLQILVARYGAAGSERVAATDYYMKQIIDILLSDIHKYIVECVVNDSGLFGMGDWSHLDDEVCQILKVTKEVRVKLSKNYKHRMLQEFQAFKTVTQKFYDTYRAVQTQARTIQKQFEKITLEFNDASIAQLILWLEQNKFLKEIKKIRADWARSVEEPQESTGKIRKMSHSIATEYF